jgi:hypothetical protein
LKKINPTSSSFKWVNDCTCWYWITASNSGYLACALRYILKKDNICASSDIAPTGIDCSHTMFQVSIFFFL